MLKIPFWVKSGLVMGILATFVPVYGMTNEYLSCQPRWEGMCGLGLAIIAQDSMGLPLLVLLLMKDILGRAGDGYVFVATWIAIAYFVQYFIVGSIVGCIGQFILKRMSKEKARKARGILWGVGGGVVAGIVVIKLSDSMYWPLQDLWEAWFGYPSPDGQGTVIPCPLVCTVVETALAILSTRISLVLCTVGGAYIGYRRTRSLVLARRNSP